MDKKSETGIRELADILWNSLGRREDFPKYEIRATLSPLAINPQERVAKIENRFEIYRNLENQTLKTRVMQYILEDSQETNGRVPELLAELDSEDKAHILYEIARTITRTNSPAAQKALTLLFNERYPTAYYFQALILAQTGNEEDTKAARYIADNPENYGLTLEQAQDIIEIVK